MGGQKYTQLFQLLEDVVGFWVEKVMKNTENKRETKFTRF